MKKFVFINIIFIFSLLPTSYSQWTLSGANLYPDAMSTNVGIGNTTPGVKLDVTGDSRSTRFVSNTFTLISSDNFTYDGKTTYNYGLNWALDSWNPDGASAWLSGWGGIKLFTGSTPRLSITNSGNVGIGTTSPGGKLQIADGGDDNTKYGAVQIVRAANPSDNVFYLSFIRNGQNVTGIGYVNNTSTLGIWTGGTNNAPTPTISFLQNQNVGIGTLDTKGYKLAVAGNLIAEKAVIKLQTNWPDYVFDSSYDLKPLSQIEKFIKANKHLPEVPSLEDIKVKGIDLGDAQTTLLKKIEELTLYLIEQNKKQQALEKAVSEQNYVISGQQNEINTLKERLK